VIILIGTRLIGTREGFLGPAEEMFSGLIIEGNAYHTRCWEQTRLARSTVSAYAQRSGAPKRRRGRRKP
jgi:hypothetical protein